MLTTYELSNTYFYIYYFLFTDVFVCFLINKFLHPSFQLTLVPIIKKSYWCFKNPIIVVIDSVINYLYRKWRHHLILQKINLILGSSHLLLMRFFHSFLPSLSILLVIINSLRTLTYANLVKSVPELGHVMLINFFSPCKSSITSLSLHLLRKLPIWIMLDIAHIITSFLLLLKNTLTTCHMRDDIDDREACYPIGTVAYFPFLPHLLSLSLKELRQIRLQLICKL